MKQIFSCTFLFLPLLALTGCYYDNLKETYPAPAGGGGCDTTSVTYTAAIAPILQSNCALSGCHDAASSSSGVNLSDHAGATAVATNGRLLGTVTHSSGYSPMPKNGAKLDDCTISKIQKWVADGAPNN